jgi:molybdenum cofactor biosynthesis enzyme MoaA
MNQNTFCSKCHRIPSQCCCALAKELTDDEIADLIKATNDEIGFRHVRIFDFVKVLLRKVREI